MIGRLPKSVVVNGKTFELNTDYRICLNVLQAFSDPDLNEYEKSIVLIQCLYKDSDRIEAADWQECINQGVWFLNCGDTVNKPQTERPLYDWEQDEQIIFSAINKVANKEVREVEYMHFWTFIALFNEIGEGSFSTIVSIRQKKSRGKKLEDWEREFYKKNKDLVDLKKKYTEEEQAEIDALLKLLG